MMAIDEIIKLLKKVTSKRSEVFKLYLNGTKQRDIGKKLNLSQSYISRIIKNLCLELKAAYEKGA
ncbi:hypothetical protein SDC9_145690 [bioreactor metagenome]|uniref:RNA polymerase sigma-70 region 4 domain-containing protein n=1 Tax=bioreactor metagenome TaxID=1076179 RepID=A0A645ECW4_9ZZZZ